MIIENSEYEEVIDNDVSLSSYIMDSFIFKYLSKNETSVYLSLKLSLSIRENTTLGILSLSNGLMFESVRLVFTLVARCLSLSLYESVLFIYMSKDVNLLSISIDLSICLRVLDINVSIL